MTPSSTRTAVIMAGGSGERFWPLSRQERPKQLLRLASKTRTLLEEAIDRIEPLIPADRVFVQTSTELQDVIRRRQDTLAAENILAEPMRRNTAGCLIWAAASLLARYGEDQPVTMAVLTADHRIGETEKFRDTVAAALEAAENNDALVTIGIKPTRPDTGFGYIEEDTSASGSDRARPVKRFREKPDADTAEEFVKAGNFYWNSGMFFWRVSVFFDELRRAQPEMGKAADAIIDALKKDDQTAAEKAFASLESISIDYALLEKASQVRVVPADFPWDDVGAWDSLERTRDDEKDAAGNIAVGEPVLVDVKGSIVYNDSDAAERPVAVVGLENVVVVNTDDAVLVVAKDRVQDVKKVVAELKERKAKQL